MSSPYRQIIEKIASIDFFRYNCHLTTNCFLETMCRYCYFFKHNANFLPMFANQCFSQFGILSTNSTISIATTNNLLRMVERACVFDETFPGAVSDLMNGCNQVITLYEEKPQMTSLTDSELTTLYNIVSKLVS